MVREGHNSLGSYSFMDLMVSRVREGRKPLGTYSFKPLTFCIVREESKYKYYGAGLSDRINF